MLVKVRGDDPSRLSSTERTVVNWLKSWTGAHALPGIAVVKSEGADVIVWTPKTCVVVVLKGFTERVNGTLVCAAAEPWTIEGEIAPLEGVQTGTEPMEEVNARTRALEHELRSAPGRESVAVTGIVLVIPQLGTRIALEKGPLPSGIDVVVGDGPSSLRAYFNRIAGDESGNNPIPADSWDAAQVGQALGALGFAAAATYSDLIAEGFPAPRADRGRPRDPAPVDAPPQPAPVAPAPAGPAVPIPAAPLTGSAPRPQPKPRPQQPPPPQQPGPAQQPAGQFAPPPGFPQQPPPQQPGESFSAAPQYPSQSGPYSVPFDPRPAPEEPRRRGRSVVPLVLLAFLVIVLAVAATCTGGGNTEHPSTGPGVSTTSESDVFTTPSGTTTPDPTIPSETIGPVCYPLQPCPGR
ncbi:hypothetical protein [Nocardia macrotermitis]|uniref:NERD domain-containing protein n=1 Tax=Nocardia macrotermitis TaxID=2585198 RepID=A0A7K0D5J9_9NOCA|nr:hypothetical protein [Nocardia macrotermitis]MQY21009.1 hypothetical protein [Nocardia macrotermitis]